MTLFFNDYQKKDILYWVETPLQEIITTQGWRNFSSIGSSEENISLTSGRVETFYLAPVVEENKDSSKILILIPNVFVFSYHGKKINGFFYEQRCSYLWIFFNQLTCVYHDPHPCVICGWYCQQTCHTWKNAEKYYWR